MDIRPTDLPLLVSLDALLELKNVTRAAERLHLSQPALSSQLARLRILFKDPLLTPSETGRGMVATPKAMELAAPLREAIEKLSLLGKHDSAFAPAKAAATFRIAGTNDAINALGPCLVRRVQEHGNPAIRLRFVHTAEDGVLENFESGAIDLLIGTSLAVPAALRLRRLGDDRYVLVQRRRHPRGVPPLTLASYCALQHLQVADSHQCNAAIDEHLQRHGHQRQVAVTVPHYGMAREILLGTDMVATVPASLLAAGGSDAELESFELPFAVPGMSLAMAWHRRSDADPAHRWLRDRILGMDIPAPLDVIASARPRSAAIGRPLLSAA